MSCRRMLLQPHDDCKIPGVFLHCKTAAALPLEAYCSASIVDQKDPDKSVTKGEASESSKGLETRCMQMAIVSNLIARIRG